MIKQKNLSDKLKKEYAEIMAIGNRKLEEVSNLFPEFKTVKKFRMLLFKANPCSLSVFKDANIPLNKSQAKALTEAFPLIQKVRDIEMNLLAGYTKAVYKLANKTKKLYNIPLEDCIQVGYIGLLDAIYAYTKPEEASFFVFAYHSISNRLSNMQLNNNPLSSLSPETFRLMSKFDKIRTAALATGKRLTNEEILAQMPPLKPRQQDRLLCALNAFQTIQGSSLCDNQDENGEGRGFDYSAFARNIDFKKKGSELEYIMLAYKETPLTTLEREIVETFLCPYHGWQTDLAKKSINPNTNKPYSNRGIAYLLECALAKIKQTYISKYGDDLSQEESLLAA